MAGKICPKCGQFTFFETVSGRKCTKCGLQYSMENVELVELLTNKEMVKWQGENVLNVERTHLS